MVGKIKNLLLHYSKYRLIMLRTYYVQIVDSSRFLNQVQIMIVLTDACAHYSTSSSDSSDTWGNAGETLLFQFGNCDKHCIHAKRLWVLSLIMLYIYHR